jgi:hypothetical protein
VGRTIEAKEAKVKTLSILEPGGIVAGSTADEFAVFYKAEAVKWAQVAKAANVRVE